MERLNKYIASCGICSRRKADELIQQGKVKINDIVITNLGEKVNENDIVKVNNKIISKEERKVYIALNKPKGYVTTNSDQFDRKSVIDLIHEDVRVYPIGRLDMYTEGLLLLTNDGEFSNKMMHPKHEVEKTYIVTTDTNVTDEQLNKLRNGVDIGDYITRPAKAKLIGKDKVEIIISEGKNRQVRRMCESVGINLLNLRRIKVGYVKLGSLQSGKYRYLTKEEINHMI
jgi:23S rRNA pseudouridine2605 synthase